MATRADTEQGRPEQPVLQGLLAPLCVSAESAGGRKVKMLKFKAFCLDYWQFLCLQPLQGAYKR